MTTPPLGGVLSLRAFLLLQNPRHYARRSKPGHRFLDEIRVVGRQDVLREELLDRLWERPKRLAQRKSTMVDYVRRVMVENRIPPDGEGLDQELADDLGINERLVFFLLERRGHFLRPSHELHVLLSHDLCVSLGSHQEMGHAQLLAELKALLGIIRVYEAPLERLLHEHLPSSL